MVIKEKLGNMDTIELNGRKIDWLELECYETRKRILHKTTQSGRSVSLKFLTESPEITRGDVFYEDEWTLVVAEILHCDCLVIKPQTIFETASLCYEIGNKHVPLFFESDSLLIPFEAPLFRLLTAQGYSV